MKKRERERRKENEGKILSASQIVTAFYIYLASRASCNKKEGGRKISLMMMIDENGKGNDLGKVKCSWKSVLASTTSSSPLK